MTGGIPSWLGNLTRLTSLTGLNTNQLDGTIPDLSRLVNLTVLSLRDNQLSGPIPAALGQLASLEHLYLSVNQLSGDFPAALGNLDDLRVTRFASNPLLTGCVPLGLRYLLTAPDFESTEFDPDRRPQNIPAQDFIPDDANGDGDTDDRGDSPGLYLPFCMVSGLTFSDVSLTPAFASATAAYTASVASTVAATTVTATLDANADSSDRVSIRKGTASYANGAAVPLAVGPNEITVTATPTDGTPTLTYTVTIFREGEDQATLTALYNSTGGASWTDKTNWGSTTEPLDEWFGVTADSSGNVTALELPGNNLSGTLPAALGSFTGLTTLDLSDNRLSGTIPDLSALTSLQDPVPWRQPVERDDPGLAGQPHRAARPVSARQPVDRGNPGGTGRPQPAGCPVPGRQPAKRADSGRVGQPLRIGCHSVRGQRLDRDACPTGCAIS